MKIYKYKKKSSYEDIREIVLEKEKPNNPAEDKFKKGKVKMFKNNPSNQKVLFKII